MRKNKMMRLASCLLVAVLLTTSMISGTFAKYVSEATGADSARVAKWDIDFAGKDDLSKEFKFDLFATIEDTKAPGGDEKDVADGKIIAPGTCGSFDIDLVNNSEVNAQYSVDYTLTNTSNVPIEFSLDGLNWKSDIDDLDVTKAIAMNGGKSETITVQWRWAFIGAESANYTATQTDETDTKLGLDARGSDIQLSVTANVIVEQID